MLTDFDAYPEWNPFIRSIQGNPEVGSRLSIRIEPPGAREMNQALKRRAEVAS